jgi:tRNA pseudouridine32 synthase/23S rRNA pseudouridine746 synthase/23S rRNA pseudouridine1911/1915/1917 synthase
MMNWKEIRDRYTVIEDDFVLALNKPSGITVTGDRNHMDIVRLAAEENVTLYPVHRIDKAASGMILFTKQLKAHGSLTRQFNKRSVSKFYLAFVRSDGLPEHGLIDLPLSVGRKGRVRIAAPRERIIYDDTLQEWRVNSEDVMSVRNYPSKTIFTTIWQNGDSALVLVSPITGRRHQIRVHLAWIGHPIIGDPLFEASGSNVDRTYLHSWQLNIDATWRTGERILLEAIPDSSFWTPMLEVRNAMDRMDAMRNARSAASCMTH